MRRKIIKAYATLPILSTRKFSVLKPKIINLAFYTLLASILFIFPVLERYAKIASKRTVLFAKPEVI